MESQFSTAVLQEYLLRWRAGDASAINFLLQRVLCRLRHLAARMLRGFPNIRPYIDCDDVLQNSILRFMRTLQTIQPATTRDFFNLAAVHMRRELIDLARRASRTIVTLSLNRSVSGDSSQNMPDNIPDTLQPEPGAEDFALWVRFHEAVENLPLEEREVIGLIFYHGWKQRQIAELFQVNERTIRRRWVSACKHLRTVLRKEFDS